MVMECKALSFSLDIFFFNAISMLVNMGKQVKIVDARMMRVVSFQAFIVLETFGISDDGRQGLTTNYGQNPLQLVVFDNFSVVILTPLQNSEESFFGGTALFTLAIGCGTLKAVFYLWITGEFMAEKLTINRQMQLHTRRNGSGGLFKYNQCCGTYCGMGYAMLNLLHLIVPAGRPLRLYISLLCVSCFLSD